eukprot:1137718-Rhodomonas_salina.2
MHPTPHWHACNLLTRRSLFETTALAVSRRCPGSRTAHPGTCARSEGRARCPQTPPPSRAPAATRPTCARAGAAGASEGSCRAQRSRRTRGATRGLSGAWAARSRAACTWAASGPARSHGGRGPSGSGAAACGTD